jgi:hypothetical protein
MVDVQHSLRRKRAEALGATERLRLSRDHDVRSNISDPRLPNAVARHLENQALKVDPDQAILRLARALARRAAREDHARACAEKAGQNETSRDLRPLFDRSSE